MSDERLDDEVARLFAACRAERPSESVREALLAEARRAAPRRSRSLGVALALAAAFALLAVGLAGRRNEAPSIGAERLDASPTRALEAATAPTGVKSPPPPEPSPVRETTSAKSAPKRAPSAPLAAPPAPLTLEEETKALERARAVLQAGDAGAALSELDAYQRAARGGGLALEATLLRIQALAAAGRTREASELAARFVAANPNSPLVERARRYVLLPDSGQPEPGETVGKNGRNQ